MFEKDIYIERRARLLTLIPEGGIILLPANGESAKNYLNNNYDYSPDSTFLYFMGLDKPNYVGLLDLDSGEQIIFGDDISLTDIVWMGSQPSLSHLAQSVGIEQTKPMQELASYVKKAKEQSRRIHFLPPYRAEIKILLSELLDTVPSKIAELSSVELALAVVSLREIKSESEIKQLELASEIGYLMQCKAMSMCAVGTQEKQIALELKTLAQSKGRGLSFRSIVSHNGQTLHNTSYDNSLEHGRLMLVDCGALSEEYYASDLTRTVPVSGKFTQKQKDIYNIVYRANNLAFELSRPGELYQDIHLKVATQISEDLISLSLMKGNAQDAVESGAYSLFMPHGLGHMLGMDVHDMENIGENYVGYDKHTKRSESLGVSSLRMGRKLKRGFVMTVEPGIYFIPELIASWRKSKQCKEFINFTALDNYLDFGGIRLEDDMLITEQSNRMIGAKRAPASIEEIENFMKK